ncbi:ArnT family glycosyltransferase, partial [Candidatus Omnitrophota bacterium]
MGKNAVYLTIGILCFHLVNNFIWLKLNAYPGGPAEAIHMLISLKVFNFISLNIKNLFLSFGLAYHSAWPPLFYISAALFGLFFGPSYITFAMANAAYLIVLLFSVYFLGAKLFDKKTGLIAAVFISLYPMVFRYARFVGLDFALCAMVCASLCLLVYSEYFTKRNFSLFFGISLGLGMLTKPGFILFLIGPLLYTLARIIFLKVSPPSSFKRRFLNFSFFVLAGVLISSVWYVPAFPKFVKWIDFYLFNISGPGPAIGASRTGAGLALFSSLLGRFSEYFYILINDQISLLFAVVFLIACLFYFVRGKNRAFLLLWYMIPYLVLSLPSFMIPRYGRFMLPALPVIALISAAGIRQIPSRKVAHVMCFLAIALGLVQFFDVSYVPDQRRNAFFWQTPIGPINIRYHSMTDWNSGAPRKQDWKIDKIADSLAHPQMNPSLIGVICGDRYIRKRMFHHSQLIPYYLLLKKEGPPDVRVLDFAHWLDVPHFVNKLDEFDCIVYISKKDSWPTLDRWGTYFNRRILSVQKSLQFHRGNLPAFPGVDAIDTSFIEEANEKLDNFLASRDGKFTLRDKIELPKGYSAYIYFPKLGLLKKDSLILSFANGKAFLVYDDKELNTYGVATYFTYNGKAYDSNAAHWEIEKISSTMLHARGRWRDLPSLTQIWNLEITDSSKVKSDVFLKVDGNVDVSKFGIAKIESSFRSDYTNWLAILDKGRFKDTDKGGVVLRDAAAGFIGVLADDDAVSLPGVFFVAEKPYDYLTQVRYGRENRR